MLLSSARGSGCSMVNIWLPLPMFQELCLYTLGNLVVETKAAQKQLLLQGLIPVLASCIQVSGEIGLCPSCKHSCSVQAFSKLKSVFHLWINGLILPFEPAVPQPCRVSCKEPFLGAVQEQRRFQSYLQYFGYCCLSFLLSEHFLNECSRVSELFPEKI